MSNAEVEKSVMSTEAVTQKVAGFFRHSAEWLRSNWTRTVEGLAGAAILYADANFVYDYLPVVWRMPVIMWAVLGTWAVPLVLGSAATGALLINHAIRRGQKY